MKNIIITISLLFCISGVKAQITYQASYNHNYNGGSSFLRLEHFSANGYKYSLYQPSTIGGTIKLYNLNHTLYKTITIPALPINMFSVYYISDSLFNTNPNNFEYLIEGTSGAGGVWVFDDAGNTIFAKDSVILAGINGYPTEEPITYTPNGYIMQLFLYTSGDTVSYIYSLPGALPCNECSNGVVVSSVAPQTNGSNNGSLLNAYPNPAKNSTTIQYELPDGVNQGDIVFYDLQGRQVKDFTVDRTFNDIIVSTADLAAGTYFYILRAGGNYVGSKKMVIIK